METQNILISELTATVKRITIIKDSISDPFTIQMAQQAEMIIGQLVIQINGAFTQMSEPNDKKSKKLK